MKLKLKPLSLAVIIVVLMFGGIAVSEGLNYWETESSKVPAIYTSGQYEGSYNPADIRGSYSFEEVSRNFDIPLEHLVKAFGLSEAKNPGVFQCKDLESKYEMAAEEGIEIGTESVKVFVALYKGLPMELTDTYVPASAYQVLKENVSLTQSQIDYLNAHIVDSNELKAVQPVDVPVPTKSEAPQSEAAGTSGDTQQSQEGGTVVHEEKNIDEKLIKGKTTFVELLDWGVTKEEIEQILGKDIPNATLSVRDFCEQQGIEFSTIKAELQIIADKK